MTYARNLAESFNRRRFLKSAGVCIALPMLESLAPIARAAATRKKPIKRIVVLSNNYGVYPQAFFPAKTGTDYEMPETLKGLERHRKDFNVYSNLDHGNTGGHHGVPVFLSGVQTHLANSFPEGNISLDQKAASFVGSATRFSSLALQVKALYGCLTAARTARALTIATVRAPVGWRRP